MSNATLIIRFAGTTPDGAAGNDWVKLEQRDTKTATATDDANYYDLYQMLAYARSGKSARDYLYDKCPYAKIVDGVLTVTLPFYVWPSRNDLNYALTASQGVISAASIIEETRNFDVIFNNSATVSLPFMFAGTLTPETPFFNGNGEQIAPDITVDGSTITLSEAATCVMRASGLARGRKHSISLTLDATPVQIYDKNSGRVLDTVTGYAIEKLATTITATWDGGTENLELEIPDCVKDLVEVCGEEKIVYDNKTGDDKDRYRVYYSTCDGSILREGWYGGDEE